MTEETEVGAKVAGIRTLELVGLPTPETHFVEGAVRNFPELGAETVIFRPSTGTVLAVDVFEAGSGTIDSLVVSRPEWMHVRPKVELMAITYPTIVQPFVEQAGGAVAHYWPALSVIRLAMAKSTGIVTSGGHAEFVGQLHLDSGQFTTRVSKVPDLFAGLVAAVYRIRTKLLSLPYADTWEFELCLDRSGRLFFFQAQQSSSAHREEWN